MHERPPVRGRSCFSIAVQFPESRAHAKKQFDTFELIEHFLQDGADGIDGCLGQDGGCVAEGLAGHRSVSTQGAVADAAAGMKVLGHEPRHRHAIAVVDALLFDEFRQKMARFACHC